MSFRDELGRFRKATEEEQAELDHDRIIEEADLDDALTDVWQNTVEEFLGGTPDLHEFAFDNRGAELFRLGWVEMSEDAADARQEFFELMEMYDISRDEFDWDAWRDWYEDA